MSEEDGGIEEGREREKERELEYVLISQVSPNT